MQSAPPLCTGVGSFDIDTKYTGVWHCAQSIYREGGVAAYYKGTSSLLWQFGIHSVVV
jgi:hypothetical protein